MIKEGNAAPCLDETLLTPAMAQYWEIKKAHQDYLLFYRMGDFYELFFKDAEIAAPVLDIALTHRSKYGDKPIPMCGVPVVSVDDYLAKLVHAGFFVAICEQLESPQKAKERGYKALVKRDVVRIVTPGTLTEDSLLEPRRPNNLVAVTAKGDLFSLACIDISTGKFQVGSVTGDALTATVSRLAPREILLPSSLREGPWGDFLAQQTALSVLPDAKFNPHIEEARLRKFFQVHHLLSFGDFSKGEIAACGALLEYLLLTQKETLGSLSPPKKETSQVYVTIDAATRRNLELTRSCKGELKNSLLGVLDHTVTATGGRLFFERLSSPLRVVERLEARLEAISFWQTHAKEQEQVARYLRGVPDAERALSRLRFRRGTPRDLFSILGILQNFQAMRALFSSVTFSIAEAGELADSFFALPFPEKLHDLLTRALAEDTHGVEGDFIAPSFCTDLDQQRQLRDRSKELIAELRQHYITETGLHSLKIQFNYVLGWHIDVSVTQSSRVPETFIHRQTLASSVRYTTLELQELQEKLAQAADRCVALERQIFEDLAQAVLEEEDLLRRLTRALAIVDVSQSLAHFAREHHYVRPTFTDQPLLEIHQGRHPLVETLDPTAQKEGFTTNSCCLDEKTTFLLLTGPNMAGKSTYLRQNALITLMAHMGFFVPAESARIGLMDRLFSRIGAADDLAQGHSTFMVEMTETAAILNQATSHSFVILDEVGRGTATYDGLSLAWAIVEYLHQMRIRTLFATHYHELTQLKDTLSRLSCATLRIQEWQETIVFFHEVIAGASDRSYGLYVAKRAGFPAEVLIRAQEILETLEKDQGHKARTVKPARPKQAPLWTLSPIEEKILQAKLEELSPRAALDLLYTLQQEVARKRV
ncbi:MAG: DNA mismatch repair protein MutS [Holosporales bacterium]|jgi:DNA mismatch repair protein MutS|nr:DNA mismatch repair protein MutS [Holosporales bacterium]